MTKTLTNEPKTAAKSAPRPAVTPAEALKTTINLAKIISGNRATAEASTRDLLDAMGNEGYAAVLANSSEQTGAISQNVLLLETRRRLAETAAKAAIGRIRELGQSANQELLRLSEELNALHVETSAFVLENVRKRISAIDSDLLTPTQLLQLAGTTLPVREQRAFEQNHYAPSLPEVIGYVDGVCTSVLAEEVYDSPQRFGNCYDSLTRSIEAARERLASLKRSDARRK